MVGEEKYFVCVHVHSEPATKGTSSAASQVDLGIVDNGRVRFVKESQLAAKTFIVVTGRFRVQKAIDEGLNRIFEHACAIAAKG